MENETDLQKQKEDDEMKWLQSVVDRYNRRTADKKPSDGIDCPICHNKGFVKEIVDREAVMKPCTCMKKRQIVRNAKASGLGDFIYTTFDQYQVNEEWQQEAKFKAQRYVISPSGWFVITGQSGSGKTLLCHCIAADLLRHGYRLLAVSWPEVMRKARSDMRYRNPELLKAYQDVEVLFIDDFLKCDYRDYAMDVAYEILDHRYKYGLPTIISSEVSIYELCKNGDEALAGRINERAGQNYVDVGDNPERNNRL